MKKILSVILILILTIQIPSALGIELNNFKPAVLEVKTNPEILEMLEEVNETILYYYLNELVEIGSRFTGSDNCEEAAEYILEEFQKMGLDAYIDDWKFVRRRCRNVVATLNGSDPNSDAVFIICAHYDTITDPYILNQGNYSPGANDDGSGVASILAIAKTMSKYSFNHTVKFIAFSGEEIGLYGSLDYARKAYDKNENIVMVINLDTIGRTGVEKSGEKVKLYVPDRSIWFRDFSINISEQYKEHVDLDIHPVPNFPGCDHSPFLSYGYDGVMFVQYEPGNFTIMHTPEDTIEKINFTYLTKVARLTLIVTAEVANKPIDLQVRIVAPKERYVYLYRRPVFHIPNFNTWRLGNDGLTYNFGLLFITLNITSDEEIDNVIFTVDRESYVYRRTENPMEWMIKGMYKPLIGKHTVGVYVYSESGDVAYDEMDIFFFTLSFNMLRLFPWRQD